MKTDLFRFATLRTPQLITSFKKKSGFITHPNISQSFFLNAIKNIQKLDNARKKIRDIYQNFNPSQSVENIKGLHRELYIFSDWLMYNKNVLTAEGVKKQIVDLDELSPEKQVFVWDNLLYQIASKDSGYIRQACIQLLVASNFLNKIKDEGQVKNAAKNMLTPRTPNPPQEERQVDLYLRRLANAKVTIPAAFSLKKKDRGDEGYNPKVDYTDVELGFKRAFAIHKANYLESSKSELIEHNAAYKIDYNKSFIKAEKNHQKEVEKITADFDKKVVAHRAKLKPLPGSIELPESLKTKLNYPDFKFTFTKPLSNAYVKDKLGSNSKEVIRDYSLQDAAVPSAINTLDREIKKQRKIAHQGVKPKKVLIANGNIIKGKKRGLYCYTIGIPREKKLKKFNDSLFFSIEVGYNNAFVVSANYTLTVANNSMNAKNVELVSNSNKTMFLKLFPNKKIPITRAMIFELKGSLQLNNGVQLKFQATGHGKNLYTNGCAHVVSGDAQPEENDIHFGVNRIGIADYRKVEQEVCCYIPGEVSHIENILAKEYKERHTRNLVSTESTTEVTSEVEIENLTDTATTERNEMNAETVQVLNEDRSTNFGFSAGVSGSYAGVTVSADAYADFASSNSSSDSNSSAKTYAEDVTRRALERVVQKITEKRTSKILKEYEENNRHGFDNRNGDKHVTGIYRWVDKIYTNRLVNYGKRLMYEFLIPEPARFYRTAISTILETGEETSEINTILEVPITPEELGFTEPGDINEGNYQTFASAYHISLDPPIKEFEELTHSVTALPKPDGDPFNFSINDLLVPDGYQANEASASITYVYDRATIGGPDAKFVMTLGGKTLTKKHTNRNRTTKTVNHDFIFNNPIGSKVSGSMSGDKIETAGADINVALERTPEVFEAWQNDTYNKLMAAYNAKLDAFNVEQEAAGINENSEVEAPKSNPKFNRITEQREIKRICIEMLARPFNIPIGRDFYRTITPCGNENPTEIPIVEQNPSYDNYSSHVKFFEQAFDWEIMSYLFYPYYWANKCKWIELFQSKDAADPIFQAFLQSGMARIVVPVRIGFEEAVSYFMETGDIWNGGGLVLDSESDLYLSIVEEMQEIEGVVEEEWQTTVPTSLTIVQNESAKLDEGGLPCCDDVEQPGTIKSSDVVISIPEPVVPAADTN